MSNYSVAIVVDRKFGERLLPLTQRLHVWVCDTSANGEAVKKAMAAIAPGAVWNEVGVTTFRVNENDSPEDMVFDRLGDVDLHHGEYSHDPAWTVMEIYGQSRPLPYDKHCRNTESTSFTKNPAGLSAHVREKKSKIQLSIEIDRAEAGQGFIGVGFYWGGTEGHLLGSGNFPVSMGLFLLLLILW